MRRLAVLPLVLALLVLAGCGNQSGSTDSADQSDPAAGTSNEAAVSLDFTATTLDGEAFEGSTLAGKPAVLWFWAPWCPTCRAQAPGVEALAKEYGEQVSVVGIGGLDQAEAISDYAQTIPTITHLVDPEGEVWQHFRVAEQSSYVVLDADGATVAEGYLDDADLAAMVKDLAG
ncbi:TlpA family protein disulfide reductase [Nocardioides sp.]|uniref:TlpA family protein disulfide reductase n=1 Tax=Nocardioides sp. TaxID=35761 RepID=UPI003568E377